MEIELNLPSKMIMGNLLREVCASTYFRYVQSYPTSMVINLFLFTESIRKYSYFEDTEPWREKSEYLLRMLDIDCDLKINHYVKDIKSYESRKAILKVRKRSLKEIHYEAFDGAFVKFKNILPTKKNKVCFWRYDLDNLSRRRKDILTNEVYGKQQLYTSQEWRELYEYLNSKFELIELEYRTPIREVYYHLSTSEFCIGYGGMYHNLCTSLNKPFISLVNTKYYTEGHLKLTNPKEYHCNPAIQEITNDAYFSFLIDKARDALGGRINVY